jgi:PAS domain S-box-containing protein
MPQAQSPTQVEVFFDRQDFIVSKTDLKGRLTYANKHFCDIAGYAEKEVIGQPHAIIRHPDMPRAVFKLMWDAILQGREIFAYVKNMTKNGDHYWVLAHVTPSRNGAGEVVGFHSNRRVPNRPALEKILPLYSELSGIENAHRNAKEGLGASFDRLNAFIEGKANGTDKVKSYDEFIFSL